MDCKPSLVRDTTPPALRLPINLVLECPGDTRTNVTGVAIAPDACGSVAIAYSDIVSNGCGGTKTVWRTWTATDQCGNTTNSLQTIVVQDTTKPTITCRAITVQCTGDLPAAYTNLAAFLAAGNTATDACDSALTFALVSESGLTGSCPARLTRIYRVTDDCGNFADGTQTITVDDTIAPVLTCPTNRTVECGQPLEPANTGQATATDNCSTNVTITHTDAIVGSQLQHQVLRCRLRHEHRALRTHLPQAGSGQPASARRGSSYRPGGRSAPQCGRLRANRRLTGRFDDPEWRQPWRWVKSCPSR